MSNPDNSLTNNIVVEQFTPTVVSNSNIGKTFFLNEGKTPKVDNNVTTIKTISPAPVTESKSPAGIEDPEKKKRSRTDDLPLKEPPTKVPKTENVSEIEKEVTIENTIKKNPEEKIGDVTDLNKMDVDLDKELDVVEKETVENNEKTLSKESIQEDLTNLYYKINDLIHLDMNRQKKKKTSQYIIKQRKKPPAISKQPVKIQDCYDILKYLRSHKKANDFNQPVDYVKWNIPSYPQIVSRPMDLGKIETNLMLGKYTDIKDFEKDVRQVFYNCHLFNNPRSLAILEGADVLNDIFVTKFKDILNNKTDNPTFKPATSSSRRRSSSSKSRRKSKAQHEDYVPEEEVVSTHEPTAPSLSKNEKEQLHRDILFITQQRHDLVDSIVQIINESENSGQTDVIDLETLDLRTLKRLQQFVSTVKKEDYRPTIEEDSSDSSDSDSDSD